MKLFTRFTQAYSLNDSLPKKDLATLPLLFKKMNLPVAAILAVNAMSAMGTMAIALPSSITSPATKQSTPSVPTDSTAQPLPTEGVRFDCQLIEGQHTVMYYPQSQPDRAYSWATPTELGGGWTAERRCIEISRRLEEYRPDGLQELTTGTENGYNIICATTERDPSCRIVLTVPPGQDPLATRDRVFENLAVADSGQQTDAVTTFTEEDESDIFDQIGEVLDLDFSDRAPRGDRNQGINLRPFLDPTDGGTGARL
jgi:Circadian oscillating protein COP23